VQDVDQRDNEEAPQDEVPHQERGGE